MATEITPLHTITATETTPAAFITQPYGDIAPGRTVRVSYWNMALASGSGSLTFELDYSTDNGSTWQTASTGTQLTLSTTAQNGQQDLPISLVGFPPAISQVQLRTMASIGGSPTGATACYRADLV
jgi:hypothetical protein